MREPSWSLDERPDGEVEDVASLPVIMEEMDIADEDGHDIVEGVNDIVEGVDEGETFVNEYELDDNYASFLGSVGEEQQDIGGGLDDVDGRGFFTNGCIVL